MADFIDVHGRSGKVYTLSSGEIKNFTPVRYPLAGLYVLTRFENGKHVYVSSAFTEDMKKEFASRDLQNFILWEKATHIHWQGHFEKGPADCRKAAEDIKR